MTIQIVQYLLRCVLICLLCTIARDRNIVYFGIKEQIMESWMLCFREIEEELEIVWNAATSENDRMKNVMQKTMKKLRKHEQLSQAMDSIEPSKMAYVSSDEGGD